MLHVPLTSDMRMQLGPHKFGCENNAVSSHGSGLNNSPFSSHGSGLNNNAVSSHGSGLKGDVLFLEVRCKSPVSQTSEKGSLMWHCSLERLHASNARVQTAHILPLELPPPLQLCSLLH